MHISASLRTTHGEIPELIYVLVCKFILHLKVKNVMLILFVNNYQFVPKYQTYGIIFVSKEILNNLSP